MLARSLDQYFGDSKVRCKQRSVVLKFRSVQSPFGLEAGREAFDSRWRIYALSSNGADALRQCLFVQDLA